MTQGERTDFQGADREVVPCVRIPMKAATESG
jgi:hypothetical protein